MQLAHIGIPVTDVQRSLAFYEAYFGFDPTTAQRHSDGTVIVRNADGFDLALHNVAEIGRLPEFLHFGFRLPDAATVRALRDRLRADEVRTIEDYDEPSYVGFKCLDPDGFPVESYWEPR
jgi:catechol 2,3-dioxygenase-like lactoylglutathione lyase family enzyme